MYVSPPPRRAIFLDIANLIRPGRLMHAIGNVKVSQGKLEEGLWWHNEALQHYLNTIGKGHHRTADLYHKLADDYIRLEKYTEARFVSFSPPT